MTFLSYAQNQEDVMLYRALRTVERGFYIDVGAQHPIEDSVTKAFYERGWRGINVDPVPQWAELLRADRPHDINLQLALGASGGHKLMFAVADTGLSTDNPAFIERHIQAGYQAESFEVDVSTLDEVCAAHDVSTVHFLKIDVEGAEIEVLRGFSFHHVRPWIVLIEAVEPVTDPEGKGGIEPVPSFQAWEPILLQHDYDFVYDDGLNRYYVAREKAELANHFAIPPNPLDSFVRYQEWRKHNRILELDSEVRMLTDASSLMLQRAELQEFDAVRRDSDNRLHRIAVLEQENAHLAGQWNATQHELARLRQVASEGAALRQHNAQLLGQWDVLQQEHAELRQVADEVAALRQQNAHLAGQWEVAVRSLEELSALRQIYDANVLLAAEQEHRYHAATQHGLSLETDLAALQLTAHQQSLRIVELERDAAMLEGKLSSMQILLGNMDELRRHSQLERQLQAEREQHEALVREFGSLSSGLSEQIERAAHSEQTLQQIIGSHSWRLTRPLRGLRRLLSGMRRRRSEQQPQAPSESAMRATTRRLVRQIARRGVAHPRLRRAGAAMLARSPRLKARLVSLILNQPGGAWTGATETALPIDVGLEHAGASPRVKLVFNRLRQSTTVQGMDHARRGDQG